MSRSALISALQRRRAQFINNNIIPSSPSVRGLHHAILSSGKGWAPQSNTTITLRRLSWLSAMNSQHQQHQHQHQQSRRFASDDSRGGVKSISNPYDLPRSEQPAPGSEPGSEEDQQASLKKIDEEYMLEYSNRGFRRGFRLPSVKQSKKERVTQGWKLEHPKLAMARVYQFKYSPKKMVYVCRLARGRPIDYAISQLEVVNKKGAPIMQQLLQSALRQALEKGLKRERLYVHFCYTTKGIYLKRAKIRAKGYTGLMKRYYCHVTVILRELDEAEWNLKFPDTYEFKRFAKKKKHHVPLRYNLPKVWLMRTQLDNSALAASVDDSLNAYEPKFQPSGKQ